MYVHVILHLPFSLVPRVGGRLSGVWEQNYFMSCFLYCRYTIFKDHISLEDCILIFPMLKPHLHEAFNPDPNPD